MLPLTLQNNCLEHTSNTQLSVRGPTVEEPLSDSENTSEMSYFPAPDSLPHHLDLDSRGPTIEELLSHPPAYGVDTVITESSYLAKSPHDREVLNLVRNSLESITGQSSSSALPVPAPPLRSETRRIRCRSQIGELYGNLTEV